MRDSGERKRRYKWCKKDAGKNNGTWKAFAQKGSWLQKRTLATNWGDKRWFLEKRQVGRGQHWRVGTGVLARRRGPGKMMLENSREVEMRCWKEAVGLQEMLERKRRWWVGKVIQAKGRTGGCQGIVGKYEGGRTRDAGKKDGVWKRNAAGAESMIRIHKLNWQERLWSFPRPYIINGDAAACCLFLSILSVWVTPITTPHTSSDAGEGSLTDSQMRRRRSVQIRVLQAELPHFLPNTRLPGILSGYSLPCPRTSVPNLATTLRIQLPNCSLVSLVWLNFTANVEKNACNFIIVTYTEARTRRLHF